MQVYNLSEHKRVLGAVSRRRGDWHQGYYDLASRGQKHGNIAWSTFAEYASMRTYRSELPDDDFLPDLLVVHPDSRVDLERVRAVQDAVHSLPRRQFEEVVRWALSDPRGFAEAGDPERGQTPQDAQRESQQRTLRRAFSRLREVLAPLATGAHQVREHTPLADVVAHPVSVATGDPVAQEDIVSTLPQSFYDGLRASALAHGPLEVYARQVPSVPSTWGSHSMVDGVCGTCGYQSHSVRIRHIHSEREDSRDDAVAFSEAA